MNIQSNNNAQGRYILTAAEGLDHSKTYKVQLVTTFGETEVRSALTAIKVKMGTAKLTLAAEDTVLFAKDKNDRVTFQISAKDAALNEGVRVEIKDAKYRDLFGIFAYGNGEFAIGFKDGKVPESLASKSVTLNLNIFLDGNETTKANAAAKLKLSIVK